MGRLSKILSFIGVNKSGTAVRDVKVDPGGGANVTAEHFSPAGDDSHPLPQDYAALMPVEQTGGYVSVGYIDPGNEHLSQAGEKRIYSRDGTGRRVAEWHLKNTGQATLRNDNAQIDMAPSGTITVTNPSVTITVDQGGTITTTNGAATVTIDAGGTVTTTNGAVTQTLSASGAVNISNGPGVINMAPGGVVTINGVTIAPGGILTATAVTTGTLGAGTGTIAGVLMDTHTHSPGSYKDGENRAVTGRSGAPG